MKVKTLFITIVTNIFLTMLATILMEYATLSERIAFVQIDVPIALESAIQVSMQSEEFFGEATKYGHSHVSGNEVEDTDNDGIKTSQSSRASIIAYAGGTYGRYNLYDFCKVFNDNGADGGISDFDKPTSNMTDIQTYEWLYGGISQEYTHSSLSWANDSSTVLTQYTSIPSAVLGSSITRTTINSNFKSFYDNVGKNINTVGYVKSKSGNSFKTNIAIYPVLTNMGLQLNNYNKTTSSVTTDNFSSSIKVGRLKDNTGWGYYMLTPASLGVTYIPPEVLKPAFIANLQNLCILEKLSGAKTINTTSMNNALASSKGCIDTSVYNSGSSTPLAHTITNDSDILTNGTVEYDTSTIKVKVDYFIVDFSKINNNHTAILKRLQGASATQSSIINETSKNNALYNYASGLSFPSSITSQAHLDTIRCTRVVAKVSVRMQIHVPYESQLMQMMCKMQADAGKDTGENHYGVKVWNKDTSNVSVSNDALWYTYTTYVMRSKTS